jgi:hypothetical protein
MARLHERHHEERVVRSADPSPKATRTLIRELRAESGRRNLS